jgi:acetylornithine deacetylase
MVEAAAALARSGIRLRGDVIVAAVVGELQGGIGTVAMLDAGYVPEMAIVPEPTHLAIRTLQCGALDVLIHVRGRASASATRHLTPPVNALHKMLKVIPAIEQMRFTYTPHPELPHLPLVSIGGIVAGLGHEYKMHRFEYTPDYCTVTVGIRTAPGQSEASVRADLEAALAALRSADPDLQAEVAMPPAGYAAPFHGLKYFVPAPVVPKEAPVVAALARAHETVSGKPVDHIGALIPNSYFYCDAGHLFARGAQAVSYGPAGHAFDPVHEGNVSIPNLVTCTRALALAACHLCA